MRIFGLAELRKLLAGPAELPGDLAEAAHREEIHLRVDESTRGLFTQHRAGRHVAAITLPARGKGGWISVIEPQQGTSRGGERVRFATRDQALAHSREYTAGLAARWAGELLAAQWDHVQAEVDSLLSGRSST